ncbi:MAG: hypothetical protein J7L14_02895 [Candidatus Diapherotrites archaeon]|nr:hypothetical protein [Candidatus Diapherotrites archaeon]
MKFNLKECVPDKKLCKKLKELGLEYEDEGMYWDGKELTYVWGTPSDDLIIAPTTTELLELLPVSIETEGKELWLDIDRPDPTQWLISYYDLESNRCPITFADDSLPNACAEMLIWLGKKRYVNFEEVKK